MTWTAILYNGDTYRRQIFHGPIDSKDALKEAQEKFGHFWPPAVNVIALVPGDHPVYMTDQQTLSSKERREL